MNVNVANKRNDSVQDRQLYENDTTLTFNSNRSSNNNINGRSDINDQQNNSFIIPRSMDIVRRCHNDRDIETWRAFTNLINTISQLSDRTSENIESPRLGDIIYYVARVVAGIKTINTNVGDENNDNCYYNAMNCDYRGKNDENRIPLIRDFFVSTVREFTERYLDDLVERYDIKMREKIYAVKIWLSCRIHFDHQLIKYTQQQPHQQQQLSQQAQSSRIRDTRVADRLIFVNDENETSISRIETFSPTFAMYTVCNLREPYDRTVTNDRNRFSNNINSNRDDIYYDEVEFFDNYVSAVENRNTCQQATIVGAPPSRENWINLLPNRNRVVWYVQSLLLNVRETVHRDRTLLRIIEQALTDDVENDDNGNSNSSNSCVNDLGSGGNRYKYSRNAHTSYNIDKRTVERSSGSSLINNARNNTNNNNNETTIENTSKNTSNVRNGINCTGVHTFSDSSKYEQEYRQYVKNSDNCLADNDYFSVYLSLIDDLAVQCGKLNVFEPTIFN